MFSFFSNQNISADLLNKIEKIGEILMFFSGVLQKPIWSKKTVNGSTMCIEYETEGLPSNFWKMVNGLKSVIPLYHRASMASPLSQIVRFTREFPKVSPSFLLLI